MKRLFCSFIVFSLLSACSFNGTNTGSVNETSRNSETKVNTSLPTNLVVVVSKDSSINILNSTQVADIFLARTQYYAEGEKAIPIELHKGEFREEFYQKISGKNNEQLMAYWTTLVFSGKGKPPVTFDKMHLLIAHLSTQKNYITYLNSESITDQMKIVYRLP
ncbi:hypothetical protein [Colwellia echini]|uniref:Phosphate ABC transporter substrate-binding protein n=1 Tax=Colwellia echini TaxID=1982103 RepID=A0ABY3MXJ3_9GAMM|nr:hypothetical protein [Colwellia echini]TYK65930.1 hypothetical protein CWS31_008255 [Colwellia echini]